MLCAHRIATIAEDASDAADVSSTSARPQPAMCPVPPVAALGSIADTRRRRGARRWVCTNVLAHPQGTVDVAPRLPLEMWLTILSFMRLSDMYPR
jgi:hypothetical protein